jgi:hypothetical protein
MGHAPEKVEKSSSQSLRAREKRRWLAQRCSAVKWAFVFMSQPFRLMKRRWKLRCSLCMYVRAALANVRVIELPAVIKSGESLAFILSGSKSELIAVAGGVFSPGFSAEFQLYLAVRARCWAAD